MDKIIKSGTIVTEDKIFKAEIGINGERIKVIDKHIAGSATTVIIDATGNYIFPGGIDAHVHFQLPVGNGLVSRDTFASGTQAAACGGITTVIDFATQQPGESLLDAIPARKAVADGQVCIDYSLHCAVTDWNKQTKKEFAQLVDLGIPSFKFFMAYGDRDLKADDAVLFSALAESNRLGALILVHAENDAIVNLLNIHYNTSNFRKKYGAYALALTRPNFVEEEAVNRIITWTKATGGNAYIVHLSTGEAVDAIKRAKENGINVFAETCPQYLLLNDSVFKKKNGFLYGTCPPVKKKKDNQRLWQGLTEGTIDTVATDTCSFDKKQKSRWQGDFRKIPYGMPGVETMLPLLFSEGVNKNRISLTQFVQLTSTNPAKLFGLYPKKGTIQVGSDADLVIFDPNQAVTISAKTLWTDCDWSPYEAMNVKGSPRLTLCRGKVVAQAGNFVGDLGYGKFIQRKQPFFPVRAQHFEPLLKKWKEVEI
ncbi:MAG: dihydropyrimidinase [bacterium]|nr:dihydropyrimidinase [bacterium]